jgi:hypothetical protein
VWVVDGGFEAAGVLVVVVVGTGGP